MPRLESPIRNSRKVFTPLRLASLALLTFLLYSFLRHQHPAEPASGAQIHHDGHGFASPASHGDRLHRRIVAVADLHGDLSHARSVLQMAKLIDNQGKWSGSEHDVLVSTGDLVDRGDDTIALYHLFDELRKEAGPDRVKNCLGNHEVMNALGDWRYVTPGDVESFGGVAARRRAMSIEGWIGQAWLANYSVSHTIDLLPEQGIQALKAAGKLRNDYVTPQANFVHGGIHPKAAFAGLSRINAVGHSLLSKALSLEKPTGRLPPTATEEEQQAWAELGPFWYRGYAYEDEVEACKLADEARKRLGPGVDYLVMGHTPHLDGFVHRCDPPSIHLIDTGISKAYGGEQSALVFETSLEPQDGHWSEHRRLIALYRGRRPKTVYRVSREI